MSSHRHSVLLILLATALFTCFGVYRIKQVTLLTDGIFHAKEHRQREEYEYQAFFAPNGGQPRESVLDQRRQQVSTEPMIRERNITKRDQPQLFSYKSRSIRSWGCERRTERPFIFVHCGKSGGGNVRKRLASSALGFSESYSNWHKALEDPHYHFPMLDSKGEVVKGSFVNSHFPNYRPSYNSTHPDATAEAWETFEGTLPCAAETPLGQALACPLLKRTGPARLACHQGYCNIVYAGHNYVGNELHWLPNQFLAQWWEKKHNSTTKVDLYKDFMKRMKDWSPPERKAPCYMPIHFNRSLQLSRHYRSRYAKCVQPKEQKWDQMAHDIFGTNNQTVTDWSAIYASLPVLRVTLLREPLSWLVSKFFWHSREPGFLMGISGTRYTYDTLKRCDNNDLSASITTTGSTTGSGKKKDGMDVVVDWVSHASLGYIHQLCGEDCVVRMHHGTMTLKEAEVQARRNLQQSFAVVGLLEESATFFDMITARAQYMNTSLHPSIEGEPHKSRPGEGMEDSQDRCKELFAPDTSFAQTLTERSPQLAALKRLYRVGVTVNRHQKEELEECGSLETTNTAT
ncbi:expressed unknown protein [Seminavis robusta]|uniref:Sulfotransferase n=1 Tax=Seminavis robusta TaxID=568900 RepID=A0A9N8EUJ5_9STRA|nr:expressed unknown protein [Seminavis robusta]|eukprot:Sro1665_g289540.1 n/a (572) ;mRNA; f:451-2166